MFSKRFYAFALVTTLFVPSVANASSEEDAAIDRIANEDFDTGDTVSPEAESMMATSPIATVDPSVDQTIENSDYGNEPYAPAQQRRLGSPRNASLFSEPETGRILTVLGGYDYLRNTAGALDFYFSPRFAGQASYEYGLRENGISSTKKTMMSISAKFFANDYTYFLGGAGYKQINGVVSVAQSDVLSLAPNESNRGTFTSTTAGLRLGIGNQVEWNHIVVGCTWVGYFMPMRNLHSSSFSQSTNNEFNHYLADMKRYEERLSSLELIRLHLGVTF